MKNTVYPTNGEGFPPASFWRLGEAMAYSLQMARELGSNRVAMCRACDWSPSK